MDKYAKIKKIGEGSFGKALLVKSKVNGKQYVVKEINMQRMSPRERKEAKKETAVLAQLSHSNIVSYLESFEEIGNLYIVMDYCDGGDLYARINQQRGILFHESQILDWFVQLCLAIKHIHDRKILHRDIKSQNIFLTKNNLVKLGDFGIAKVLNSTVELARTCIGTPYYLSPEICENRPYNNKSDVWSMGCVLYELTTLKHAFEAGNMKNLVLKIIRGSYPPVPSKYSYELRSLIASLFKRNPRDRPSVNNILRKNLISNRIPKYLSESEYADEFSHTVMHGAKIKQQLPVKPPTPGRELPPPPAPRPLPAKRPAPAPMKYDPKSVYGPSVARPPSAVRKSKENQNRKSASNNKRPSSAGPAGDHRVSDLAQKKRELQEKERKRREEIKKKEDEYARQHRELQDRQKRARMKQARESSWKNLVDSLESDDSRKSTDPPKSPSPVQPQAQPLKDRPNYDQYHAYLDKMEQQRNRDQNAGFAAVQGENAARDASEAAARARRVEEFLQRKKEAALYKARGQGAGLGAAAALGQRPVVPKATPVKGQPARSSSGRGRPGVNDMKNRQEQEYLERLKKIRLQNFNDRRAVMERNAAKINVNQSEADVRKKKIEALRAQADARAQKLKAELERKRREAFEQGAQKYKEECAAKAKREDNPQQKPVVVPKPAPVMPVTAAMQAIGARPPVIHSPPAAAQPQVSMTAMMEAIGAKPKEAAAAPQLSSEKSTLQQKKDDILKRINEKPPVPDRPKWGAEPVMPKMQQQQQEEGEEGVESARQRWGGGDGVSLGRLKLEETGSHMEATGIHDKVIKNPAAEEVVSARKQWGKPGDDVLNLLNEAKVDSSTVLINPAQSPESASPASSTGTIPVVSRSPGKGTLVISKAQPEIKEESPAVVAEPLADPTDTASLPTVTVATDSASTQKATLVIDKSESKLSPKGSPRSSVEVQRSKEKLFEKVELLEDDDDDEEEEVIAEDIQVLEIEDEEDEDEEVNETGDAKKQNFLKATAGVMLGLTIGHFDVNNPKVLRTCSLPDLTKALKADIEEDLDQKVAASLNMDAMDTEDEEDENQEENEASVDQSEENNEKEQEKKNDEKEKKEDDIEEDPDEDEDDLETMRQTMQSLLIEDEGPISPLATDPERKKKLGTKVREEVIVSPEPDSDDMFGDGDKISVSASSDSLLSDGPIDTIVPGKEEWCSDEDEEGGEVSDDDLFSRLEESRMELEEELGCQSFLDAYKSVQAIHEDEDENIEDGEKLVEQILGDKKHLYDKIVKLVMADGAFTEDND